MDKNRLAKWPSNTNEVDKMIQDMINKCKNTKKDEEFRIVECPCDKCYEELENKDEPILYVILNKDAILESEGVKYAIVSHLTSKLMADAMTEDMSERNQDLLYEWLDSFVGYGNTVVLEASEEELYDNCMAHYDNVHFVKLIEDSSRVAHHNWVLDVPQHTGVAFFGIKSEMPKWVRKLPLAK